MSNDSRSQASLAMERYADGDLRAFGEVYDALASKLYGYFRRLARSDTIAEDLLQQTFLKMHDARGRFEPGSEVEPWAFAIARRLFVDWHRREHFRRMGEFDEKAVPSSQPDAEAILHGHELSDKLRRSLEALPPQQREMFLLVREEGLTMAQAAEVLGITVTAAKLRAHRAYEGLRLALEGLDDGGER